jgi:hypothetical protein
VSRREEGGREARSNEVKKKGKPKSTVRNDCATKAGRVRVIAEVEAWTCWRLERSRTERRNEGKK